MKTTDRSELLENEWFHVRYSGETPEIALHSSLYFLTEDAEGPGLQLKDKEWLKLLEAAAKRYADIIFRDILPENRDLAIYRGVLRSICNWRRYKRFCQRHDLEWRTMREDLVQTFVHFLKTEVRDIEEGLRESSINCSIEELQSFAIELEVSLEIIHESMERFCLKP